MFMSSLIESTAGRQHLSPTLNQQVVCVPMIILAEKKNNEYKNN